MCTAEFKDTAESDLFYVLTSAVAIKGIVRYQKVSGRTLVLKNLLNFLTVYVLPRELGETTTTRFLLIK